MTSEEEFDIEISDSDIKYLKTVGDVQIYIKKGVNQTLASPEFRLFVRNINHYNSIIVLKIPTIHIGKWEYIGRNTPRFLNSCSLFVHYYYEKTLEDSKIPIAFMP